MIRAALAVASLAMLAVAAPGAESSSRSALESSPGSSASSTGLDSAWRHWAYWRPIEIGDQAIADRLIRVPIPEPVLARAKLLLGDLRILDDSGQEVGWAFHSGLSFGHRPGSEWGSTKLLDAGYVPGHYTQAIAEVDFGGRAHELVVIQLLNRRDEFFAWAEIASSSDYETWRVLRDKVPVYHFEETREGEAMRLTYPRTRDRWLRIRLDRAGESVAIASLSVGARFPEFEPELEPARFEFEPSQDSPPGESWWQSSSNEMSAPIVGLRVATDRDEFHRPVKVSVSRDGKAWRPAGRGQIYRFLPTQPGGDSVRESLEVEFLAQGDRFWRIAIVDGNDAPIEDLDLTLLRAVQNIVFRPVRGRSYRLLYGNSSAQMPDYELSDLLDFEQRYAAPLGSLGEEHRNENFVSSRPFTERHPELLWAALLLAVLVLGALALKSLR